MTPARYSHHHSPRDDQGLIAVEFVVWLPVFLTVLGFIVDITMILLIQHDMLHVARDAARRLSTGDLDAATVTAFVNNALLFADRPYAVTPLISGNDAQLTISLPLNQADVFGLMRPFVSGDLATSMTMRLEQAGAS